MTLHLLDDAYKALCGNRWKSGCMDRERVTCGGCLRTMRMLKEAEKLKVQLTAGASYMEIGAMFKLTKGAVAGKVYRAKLKGTQPPRELKGRKKRQPRTIKKSPAPVALPSYEECKAPFMQTLAKPNSSQAEDAPDTRVTFMELRSHHCRWPYGDPRTEMFYCGATAVDAHAYCPQHCAIAYRPSGLTPTLPRSM